MRRAWAILLLAALTVFPGCASKRLAPTAAKTRTTTVLVPDEDGTTGRVRVTTPAGTTELSQPYESTQAVSGQAPTAAVKRDEADVKREFEPALAALPPPAEHFTLYFRTDTTELTDDSRALLPKVLRAVTARQFPDVTVTGHTDTTGSTAGNYRLGLERATLVRKLLVDAGVDAAVVETASRGEADLLVRTRNNTAEPRNRRVEISVR